MVSPRKGLLFPILLPSSESSREESKILPPGLPPTSSGPCSPDAGRTYCAALLRKKDSKGGHRQDRVAGQRKDLRWNADGVAVF